MEDAKFSFESFVNSRIGCKMAALLSGFTHPYSFMASLPCSDSRSWRLCFHHFNCNTLWKVLYRQSRLVDLSRIFEYPVHVLQHIWFCTFQLGSCGTSCVQSIQCYIFSTELAILLHGILHLDLDMLLLNSEVTRHPPSPFWSFDEEFEATSYGFEVLSSKIWIPCIQQTQLYRMLVTTTVHTMHSAPLLTSQRSETGSLESIFR